MPVNMSYYRFENTARALRECIDALEEDGPEVIWNDASDYERAGIHRLFRLAKTFLEYDDIELTGE